jgi:hypothetical protein
VPVLNGNGGASNQLIKKIKKSIINEYKKNKKIKH